jgi:hypothetical protein
VSSGGLGERHLLRERGNPLSLEANERPMPAQRE